MASLTAGSVRPVEIRLRGAADVDPCLAVLRQVHAHDGYPSTLDEVASFLTPDFEVAAWVADRDGEVVGHVALHAPATSRTVSMAASVLGKQKSYVLVSRLFVKPSERGQGIARALLGTAVERARFEGRRAVLDVGQDFPPAASLYESSGWLRLGSLGADEGMFAVWVYASPVAQVAIGTEQPL
jgi:GNAT superfamily N-acetyltransferase